MDLSKINQQPNETQKTMKPRTAILWGREDLLGQAVESILTADRDWQVIKVLGTPDLRALTQEIEKTKPEIVIINQSHSADAFPVLVHLMERFPEMKIITVNPDNNLVEVYNKQKVCLEEVADLLSVIGQHSKSTIEGGENKS